MAPSNEPSPSGPASAGSQAKLGQAVLPLIQDGMTVGLGTGRAAVAFVHALAERVKQGLRVRGIPTSISTANLASALGIPLTTLEEVEVIDVAVDGADEVDPNLDMIKGLGGALLREKIVAAASQRLVILVGSEKMAPALGTRGVLPVEVTPFGISAVARRLASLGYPPTPRQSGGRLFTSDNGNYILDCKIGVLENPLDVETRLRAIPGVVGTGLFLGMAESVYIATGDQIDVKHRPVSANRR